VLITKNAVVTLTYRVTDSDGNVVDKGSSPMVYLHGGYDGIFPRIEESLHGKAVGDKLEVKLQPNDAFGEYDAELVKIEERSLFPENIEVGMQFERASEDGEDDELYTITDITDDKIVVDGNHPLAGVALVFSCEVNEVRVASAEEISHGHIHGLFVNRGCFFSLFSEAPLKRSRLCASSRLAKAIVDPGRRTCLVQLESGRHADLCKRFIDSIARRQQRLRIAFVAHDVEGNVDSPGWAVYRDVLVQRRMKLLFLPLSKLGGGFDQRIECRCIKRLGIFLVAPHRPRAHQRRLGLVVLDHLDRPALIVFVLDDPSSPSIAFPEFRVLDQVDFVGLGGVVVFVCCHDWILRLSSAKSAGSASNL
jgi:FKBP-type peptidyl-prolyl cis-trans isomerase SlyD